MSYIELHTYADERAIHVAHSRPRQYLVKRECPNGDRIYFGRTAKQKQHSIRRLAQCAVRAMRANGNEAVAFCGRRKWRRFWMFQ